MTRETANPPDHDRAFMLDALPWLRDVSRYALSLARNTHDAEDLLQETFLRAYRAWHTFEHGSDCRAWLFRICRNEFLRTRDRSAQFVDVDEPVLEMLAAVRTRSTGTRSPEEVLSSIDLPAAVEHALQLLPQIFREVILLVDLHDHSYHSASDILGVAIGTVRSRLFRGRRLLRESLLAFARDAGIVYAGAE
jgi:RNA polymerase sigma-70 factor, ECF subfamily